MSNIKSEIKQTLNEYLNETLNADVQCDFELRSLIYSIETACIKISNLLRNGAMDTSSLHPDVVDVGVNVHGEIQKKLDVISNQIFIDSTKGTEGLLGLASEEMEAPVALRPVEESGGLLLVFDPLDGSSNIDNNVAVGSIFSVLRVLPKRDRQIQTPDTTDFLQRGDQQVAAGYAIYGPSTMLVLSVGAGVHGFTLAPETGGFYLTHPDIKIPEETQEFAINASNQRFWHEPVQLYIDECLAGRDGVRRKDFNMRWIASLVAEAHRIFMRGGVFLYPKDSKNPGMTGRLRLLYEGNPIGFLVEQAGGRVSDGYGALLELKPTELHQKVGLVFGSRSEVERLEAFHNRRTSEWI